MVLSWLAEHWFAASLLVVYTALLVVHARAGARVGKSAAGFLVGGRGLGGVVVGVSFYATFASTNSYIGFAGKSYEYGLPWLVMPVLLVVAILAAAMSSLDSVLLVAGSATFRNFLPRP